MTTRKAAPAARKTAKKAATVSTPAPATQPATRTAARSTAPTRTTTTPKATPAPGATTAAAATNSAPMPPPTTLPGDTPATLAAAAKAAAAAVTRAPTPVSAAGAPSPAQTPTAAATAQKPAPIAPPAAPPPAPIPAAVVSPQDLVAAVGSLRTAVNAAIEERTAAIRKELADTRRLVESQHASTIDAVRALQAHVDRLLAPPAPDGEIEASVISLRRLLSELVEQRMESVMKVLADLRNEAACTNGGQARLAERLDDVLQGLGALKFVAEPMDLVDPIIHAVIEERSADGVPDGLVVATVRPGYRTARGRVLSKAAVAVSRN